jgi:hypothetical protein
MAGLFRVWLQVAGPQGDPRKVQVVQLAERPEDLNIWSSNLSTLFLRKVWVGDTGASLNIP